MSLIVSFIKLSSQDKMLALKSIFWVIIIRFMLWVYPFPSVQKKVQKITNNPSKNDLKYVPVKRIRLMIVLASSYVPRATCLVQALAGYILFSKYGYRTQIKIGVLNDDGQFEAHAWVEHGGSVVLGESEKDFKTILDIDSSF